MEQKWSPLPGFGDTCVTGSIPITLEVETTPEITRSPHFWLIGWWTHNDKGFVIDACSPSKASNISESRKPIELGDKGGIPLSRRDGKEV